MAKYTGTKYLTVQQAIEQDPKAPLFLINVSEESDLTDNLGGDVFLSARQDGDIIPIKVPKTWLPTEVTTLAPRDAILKSRFFLMAVNNSIVKIITKEYAEQLSNATGAEEERQRLHALDARMRAAASSHRVIPEKENEAKEKQLDTSEAEPVDVPVQFKAKVTAMNEMSEKEAVVELRQMRRLNESRAVYLMENTKHARIKHWLKERLEDTE